MSNGDVDFEIDRDLTPEEKIDMMSSKITRLESKIDNLNHSRIQEKEERKKWCYWIIFLLFIFLPILILIMFMMQ